MTRRPTDPTSILFRRGDQLRLVVVAGRWFWPVNPLTGQSPTRYRMSKRGTCTFHWSPDRDAHLLHPVIPPD